jgi:hypothetical protein
MIFKLRVRHAEFLLLRESATCEGFAGIRISTVHLGWTRAFTSIWLWLLGQSLQVRSVAGSLFLISKAFCFDDQLSALISTQLLLAINSAWRCQYFISARDIGAE